MLLRRIIEEIATINAPCVAEILIFHSHLAYNKSIVEFYLYSEDSELRTRMYALYEMHLKCDEIAYCCLVFRVPIRIPLI